MFHAGIKTNSSAVASTMPQQTELTLLLLQYYDMGYVKASLKGRERERQRATTVILHGIDIYDISGELTQYFVTSVYLGRAEHT
jgi:hypothetical protein